MKLSLTPEITEKICQSLREGNYFETACLVNGISRNTAKDWLKKGCGTYKGRKLDPERDKVFIDFVAAVDEATAHAESKAIAYVLSGEHNWQARAWYLERRMPDKWGRERKVMHEGEVTIKVERVQTKAKAQREKAAE